ncbi:MAG: FixH family protein, partial [Burkholderiaceae bacterium]
MNHNTSGPWWQHRWPWIILFMLSSVIVACMVTIYIAVTTRDSLVADDYSK